MQRTNQPAILHKNFFLASRWKQKSLPKITQHYNARYARASQRQKNTEKVKQQEKENISSLPDYKGIYNDLQ